MHPQLENIRSELLSAQRRLHQLADAVPLERWAERPDPDRWSIGECVAHLNLSGAAYRPIVPAALEEARRHGDPPPRRYRRDLAGWLLWRTMGPPARVKMRTTAAFVPQGDRPAAELIAEFDRLQAEQIGWVALADGLPIHHVRIASPFNERVRYSLYSALTILPRHQHRHLWQAEGVARRLG
jgi:hypothetical protein